jgi:hypothetical protein
VFITIDPEYLMDRVVMIPLLQKLFLARDGVTRDQILKLREVRHALESAYRATASKVEADVVGISSHVM